MKNKKISINIYAFAMVFSVLNLLLYHFPLFNFILSNLNIYTYGGTVILIIVILAELFISYLFILLLSFIPFLGKPVAITIFIANSIALYFVNSYNIILDKTMMGNVINTNVQESFDLYNNKIIVYVLFLGILPSLLVLKIKIIRKFSFKKFILFGIFPLVIIFSFIYTNPTTWLWLDKNLKVMGSLSLPFSYPINALRYQIPIWTKDKKQYPLERGNFIHKNKVIVLLVIGESARAKNFSLYGYNKLTNPKLQNTKDVVVLPNTTSCATYTTEGVKCILSHIGSQSSSISKNYEYLPTYLKKHDIKVFWRTNNWGEPKIDVDLYQRKSDIQKKCTTEQCRSNNFDDILLYQLNDLIKENIKDNTFVVLHQTGSHGPSYYKKYPNQFKKFRPVCETVEIKENCSQEDLINAYDNTIVYNDDFLFNTINILKGFKNKASVMIYISDHGESLGENDVYLHGLPNFIAPDVQREIPFIIWMSEDFKKLYNINTKNLGKDLSYSQDNIFHSVMGAFGLRSSFYKEKLDIFNKK